MCEQNYQFIFKNLKVLIWILEKKISFQKCLLYCDKIHKTNALAHEGLKLSIR